MKSLLLGVLHPKHTNYKMFERLILQLKEFDIKMSCGWWIVYYNGKFLYKCETDYDLWFFMRHKGEYKDRHEKAKKLIIENNRQNYYKNHRKYILEKARLRYLRDKEKKLYAQRQRRWHLF